LDSSLPPFELGLPPGLLWSGRERRLTGWSIRITVFPRRGIAAWKTFNGENPPMDRSHGQVSPGPLAAGEQDSAAMIEADGLSKYYGSFIAIEDVSFRVPSGQIVAFLGPNGAGKSTTMKILTGYLAPSAGRARIAGFDMATDRLAGAERLGYLPENGPLYPDMTPRSLLEFFADARGMSRTQKAERIGAVVRQCELGSVIGKAIGKLSKGYRQRVGMAQVLLHEPDVLILDEPTSGLDPNQIREMRETIRRLGEKKTILLSTHILQEVEALADRVILISEGRLRFDGKPAELRRDGSSLDERFHQLTRS
jgi:ABC-2 type transport system ATP-binding protein